MQVAQDEQALQRVQRLQACVASRLGLRVEEWRLPQLAQMLDRRAHFGDLDDWLASLERASGRDKLHALADDLAVGEGYFFRSAEQLQLLPGLVEARGGRALRALCIGCGGGEEAYSLAIGLADISPDSLIEAIDISPLRLQQATAGCYGDWSMRSTPGSQRRRWFKRDTAFHLIAPELRHRVRFEQRNLCEADPAFWGASRYDLVLCRNLLMYLEPPAVERALQHIAQVLAAGGYLFLGRGEGLRGWTDVFTPRETAHASYFERSEVGVATPTRLQAGRLRPGPSPLWLRTGRDTVFELWRQGRLGQALHLADSLLIQDRSDSELLLAQVMLLLRAGRIQEAQRVGTRLLDQATTPAMGAAARFAKARGHELRGEHERAEENYVQAIKLDAGFALAHLRLAQLLQAQGAPDRAAEQQHLASGLVQFEDERRLLMLGEGQGRADLAALCVEAVPA
ncbi:MAG: methyltransferase domain-containing protein [Paucibacter sp.]|nr:methyltransferase domain-containing protein [Roseateles sp.]